MNQQTFAFATVPAPEPAKMPTPQNAKTTRAAAAVAIRPDAHTLRVKVWKFVKERGILGATDLEIQAGLDMRGSTERPRRRELELSGLIKDSGTIRMTPSGRSSVVWIDSKISEKEQPQC